jgi:hypothetical protein
MLGMALRLVLPEPHLNPDTKDVVRLGTGLIAISIRVGSRPF